MKKILSDISSNRFERVYLLYGEETYLRKYAKNTLLSALKPDLEMNTLVARESVPDPETLRSFTDTVPFFSDHRVVLIEDSGLFSASSEEYKKWLSELPEYAIVIFEEEKAMKTNALFKTVSTLGYVSEFTYPTEKEIGNYVLRAVKKANLSIREKAYYRLMELLPSDLMSIRNEVDKLVSYASDRGEISIRDVEEIVTPKLEDKIYVLTDEAAKGNAEKAFAVMSDLLAQKFAYAQIMAALTRQIADIVKARELSQEGIRAYEAAAILEKKEFAVTKLLRTSERYSVAELRSILNEALSLSCDVRAGRINEREATEMVLIRLAGSKRK